MKALPLFTRKHFQLCYSKICKKLNNLIFKGSKPFSEIFPMTNFEFKRSRKLRLPFLENSLHFVTQKFAKNVKNALVKRSEHSFSSSRYPQSHFQKCLLWPTLNLNCSSAPLFEKTVSILYLKTLQKSKHCSSQMFRTFVFGLMLTSKQFSKMLSMTNFEFKWLWRLCLTFLESIFNFVTQTLAFKRR